MSAIFFSKYIIKTSKTGIGNVVFNHVIYSVEKKLQIMCAGDQLFSSDTHTTLILGHVTGLQKSLCKFAIMPLLVGRVS